ALPLPRPRRDPDRTPKRHSGAARRRLGPVIAVLATVLRHAPSRARQRVRPDHRDQRPRLRMAPPDGGTRPVRVADREGGAHPLVGAAGGAGGGDELMLTTVARNTALDAIGEIALCVAAHAA